MAEASKAFCIRSAASSTLAAVLIVAGGGFTSTPAHAQGPAPAAGPEAAAVAPVPKTVQEVIKLWSTGTWQRRGGHFYLSGYEDSFEYNDPVEHVKTPPTFPPLNAAWQKRYDEIREAAFRGQNIFDPPANCIPFGMPQILTAGGKVEMFFKDDRITMILGGLSGMRRIWLNTEFPEEILIPQYNGLSIGHWEGTTLVIETKGIRGDTQVEPGMPHTDRTEVVERWVPLPGDMIENQITITNPDMMDDREWKTKKLMVRGGPDEFGFDYLEFSCENNRSVFVEGRTVLLDSDGKPMN